jgi:MFS family permease
VTLQQQRRTVLLYQVYMIFSEPLFWGPILIYSLQNLAHMSLSSIFFMESVVVMVLVLANVPAGALADVIGKKPAVLIGRIFLLVSIICFATMTSATGAWIGNLAWALGFALTSGAESSLLLETLARGDATNRFREVQGRAVGMRFLVAAFTSLSVGVLSSVDPRLPLYLSIPGQAIALLLVLPMHEPKSAQSVSMITMLRQGASFALRTPPVLWMIAFAAFIGAVSKVWFFTYNTYFVLVEVPLSHFGFIFFLLNIVAWLSSHFAHKVEAKVSELQLIVIIILCTALPILVMASYPVYAVAYLVLAQNIVRGFLRPFTEDFVHHYISAHNESEVRATVMSIKNALSQFAMVVALAVAGVALDYLDLTTVLLLLGLSTLVVGGLLVAWYCKLTRSERKS